MPSSAAFPPPHPCTLDDAALLASCTVSFGRSSGPGGQHRNKVQTAATLTHTPTGVSASASERRSQAENRRVAFKRLRLRLADRVRAPRSPDASPSLLWSSRVSGGRIVCSTEHRDLAPLLAEALDTLLAHRWDAQAASAALGVSATQLVKLVSKRSSSLGVWNAHRSVLGLGAFKPR